MLRYAPFKFCPRCGKPGVAELGKNAMRCGGCGFVYFHNCAAAAAAIIETGEAILLTVRGEDPQKGCYDLPGGFADYRESLEQSLTREIREELNLEIRNFRYLGSFPNVYSFEGVTYFTTDAIFVAEAPSLQALKVDREIQEVVIAGAKEIDLARIGFESIREGIKRYLKTCRHL